MLNIPYENEKVNILPEPIVFQSFLPNHVLNIHESVVHPKAKNVRYTNREIEKFFRYQDIYDYEQPKKKADFKDEAERVQGAYSLRISLGGQLVELKRKLGKKPDDLGKSKGDVIDGFSRESRNRFIKLLLSIDYEKMGSPFFYTLTYPGAFSNDPRTWKKNLDTFIKRLRREYPDLCGTWRLEPQKRGAPHFSGFLWGCDDLGTQNGKGWFSRAWFEVVGSGDEKHLRAGTGIMRVPDDEGERLKLMMYQAKYQTKAEKGGVKQEFDFPVGRYWGLFERKKLAIKIEEFDIDRSLFFKIRRVMKKKLEKLHEEGKKKVAEKALELLQNGSEKKLIELMKNQTGKNRFREVVKGKQNGLWLKMSNRDIEKLLILFVDESEPEDGW